MHMAREILSEKANLAVKNRLYYSTNHCTACERKCKIKIILSTINVRIFFRNIMTVLNEERHQEARTRSGSEISLTLFRSKNIYA